jgi:putative heme-binding domain-containing protein
VATAPNAAEEKEKIALAVAALSRLQGVDLEANPKLKQAVLKVLEKTRGTAAFVQLVRKFSLIDQDNGLLEVAAAQPAGEAGVEAMRILLARQDVSSLATALASTNIPFASAVAAALGNVSDRKSVPLLIPLVTAAEGPFPLRQQAVRSLAKTAAGSKALLELARADDLSTDLTFTAATELNSVRWPEIKGEAAALLPLPQSRSAEPLPPLTELVRMKGDVAKGRLLFDKPSPGCASCHQVDRRGIEFGPNLSEIGSKLGKQALFESILDPNAGISFGYEAFTFTLKSEDEVHGLITSETEDSVTVKMVGNIINRLSKRNILDRQQSKLSIMPAGLAAALTTQELVDLVEYLSSLKKQRSS